LTIDAPWLLPTQRHVTWPVIIEQVQASPFLVSVEQQF
jgi:hypothetical protein